AVSAEIAVGYRWRRGHCRIPACWRGQDHRDLSLRSARPARPQCIFGAGEKSEMHVDQLLVIIPGSPLRQNAADRVAIIAGVLQGIVWNLVALVAKQPML